jgi:hypothetical protein
MFKINTIYLEKLNPEETDLIDKIISWNLNPNQFEISGRGVKIDKKLSKINFDKIKLSKIKINGIGYQKFKDLGGGFLEKHGEFLAPSMVNFINVKPSIFSTIYPNKDSIQKSYGDFESTGCYLESDLNHIISCYKQTKKFKSKHLQLLKIYGYGTFEDENMNHNGDKGGYLISAEPDEKRFMQMLKHKQIIPILKNPHKTIELLTPLILGLKDLHDFGFTHLQPHFDNFYIINSKCYLVDLETLFRNSGNKFEFTIARTLDLVAIMSNYGKNLKLFKIENYSFKYLMYDFLAKLLSLYLNKTLTKEEIENNKGDMKLRPQIMKLERKSGDISDMENIFDILFHNLK